MFSTFSSVSYILRILYLGQPEVSAEDTSLHSQKIKVVIEILLLHDIEPVSLDQ
jgi:hypothetical protein